MRVLVVGGSGYLGQFLAHSLSSETASEQHEVAVTYFRHKLEAFHGPQYRICLSSSAPEDDGGDARTTVEHVIATFKPQAVINCAAISQPRACEENKADAMRTNSCQQIVDALLEQFPPAECASATPKPLLIHISTDQVFDGTSPMSSEDAKPNPVNAYGKSKAEAEANIQQQWSPHVILRSSIIYGPLPPYQGVGRTLFVQWMDGALRSGNETSFFNDEFRSPIFVYDICEVVAKLLSRTMSWESLCGVYNMGGPERLSRVDMAYALAEVRGYQTEGVIGSVPSAAIKRGVDSPPDISMDSRKLQQATGIAFKTFKDGLALTFTNL